MRRIEQAIEATVTTIAEQARADLPPGIHVERQPGGVRLSGRGLIANHAGDVRLRGLAARGGA